MEAILLYLVNAAASGAVGHYVTKALSKLDDRLPKLIEREENIAEAKQIIEEEGIAHEVEVIAEKSIRNSLLIPAITPDSATFEDKTELVLNYLNLGFLVSHRLQIDLVIPGSLISKTAFTLFSGNRDSPPPLTRQGVKIELGKGLDNRLSIFPVEEGLGDEIWKQYRTRLVDMREETKAYLSIARFDSAYSARIRRCQLNSVTAGSVQFELASIFGADRFPDVEFDSGKAKAILWREFLNLMLKSIQELVELQVLSAQDVEFIRNSYAGLKEFLDGRFS